MNNNNISDYCPSKTVRTYSIAGDLELRVTVTSNPYEIPLDCLFAMAARINKKRSFLFVSKVLGKHIPVRPYASLLSGVSLSLLLQQALQGNMPNHLIPLAMQGIIEPLQAEAAYKEIMSHQLSLPQSVAFIGFAETATAIGHAVFQTFGHNGSYIHTTREVIEGSPSLINFSEEHSHAVAHYCYAQDPNLLTQAELVVLVDDEITTGKTSLNIIRDMQGKFPKKVYYILALLDWRTEDDQEQFRILESELGITIHVISLIKGEVSVQGSSESIPPQSIDLIHAADQKELIHYTYMDQLFEHADAASQRPYLRHSGRFGLTSEDRAQFDDAITQAANRLEQTRTGAKTLCVGTGEFMYIPMRLAAEMGEGVLYQSTTRSPIHCIDREGYAVTVGYPYPAPEDPEVTHFLYNLPVGLYDDLYVFMEREADPAAMQPLLQILRTRGLQQIHVVFFSPQTIEWKETEAWQIGERN
ncbi:phosphoribosyltransferase family protein [Paenibacillus alba]|uniref:Phosphoribosyltransferase family protein n=1 Tax=Paenibacillus alba TaxID=1197127 RepID=A0ABU6GCX5_9BACL|nr:phosphoribosyltransferase family protein [Paenibacillus alba]MEC0232055.1 phosphoribosyltransferase family protein [Paenibacillus alba]